MIHLNFFFCPQRYEIFFETKQYGGIGIFAVETGLAPALSFGDHKGRPYCQARKSINPAVP